MTSMAENGTGCDKEIKCEVNIPLQQTESADQIQHDFRDGN